MRILSLALLTLLSITLVGGFSQDKPARDQADLVAMALKKAQTEYTATVEKASELLSAAFTAQIKKLEDNNKLTREQRLKLIGEFQAEQAAFEADPTALPKSTVMKATVIQYRTTTESAKEKYIKAFDTAEAAYRKKKDLVRANAILLEKDQFIFRGVKMVIDVNELAKAYNNVNLIDPAKATLEDKLKEPEIIRQTIQKADKKYNHKILELSGKVSDFGQIPMSSGLYVTFESVGSVRINANFFYLDKEAMLFAKKLKKGDEITVLGTCAGYVPALGQVVIARCKGLNVKVNNDKNK